LLRPGRLDRKIEIPLPNETSRLEILKIHAAKVTKHGEIDYESCAKLAEGLNIVFQNKFVSLKSCFKDSMGLICETFAPKRECLRFVQVEDLQQTTIL
jgi:SpoVK/Ycf46/Vps4 family AAA+-type ATPase